MDAQDLSNARAAIQRHYLFASLSERDIDLLVKGVKLYKLGVDEYLFRQEEAATRFFLVADGQVKLFRSTPDGNEKVVEIIGSGQTIAEAVLFMQRHQFPVHAQALRETRAYGIPGDVYLGLLKHNHEACMRILGDLSMRLHARLSDVLNLTQQNATFRVVRFLINELPPLAEGAATIHLTAPKQVIASRLSVKPETLSRIMATLAQQGILQVKGREVQVLDIERLRHFE